MARIPLITAALTASVVLAASPIASATNSQMPANASVVDTPAMNGNMLPLAMCATREHIVTELAQKFAESPMAVGQVDDSALVEIFVSEQGTWTILATGTDGMSCIVSAGEGFESTTLVRGADA